MKIELSFPLIFVYMFDIRFYSKTHCLLHHMESKQISRYDMLSPLLCTEVRMNENLAQSHLPS